MKLRTFIIIISILLILCPIMLFSQGILLTTSWRSILAITFILGFFTNLYKIPIVFINLIALGIYFYRNIIKKKNISSLIFFIINIIIIILFFIIDYFYMYKIMQAYKYF